MANPYRGFGIGGSFFAYIDGSYSRTYPLKNTTTETQSSRTFNALGLALPKHTVTLACENVYKDVPPATGTQATTDTVTKGASRLYELITLINTTSAGLPLTIMVPDGTTHLVVTTGSLDVAMFPNVPSDTGVEYRVTLTFENTQ